MVCIRQLLGQVYLYKWSFQQQNVSKCHFLFKCHIQTLLEIFDAYWLIENYIYYSVTALNGDKMILRTLLVTFSDTKSIL